MLPLRLQKMIGKIIKTKLLGGVIKPDKIK
jgi:hypothetical protein